MAPLGDAYIPGMLATAGEPVTLGATTVQALVDRSGEDVFRDDGGAPELSGRSVIVTVKTGSLPGLATGVAITVDGSPYKVRRWQLAELDGALTQIQCVVRT